MRELWGGWGESSRFFFFCTSLSASLSRGGLVYRGTLALRFGWRLCRSGRWGRAPPRGGRPARSLGAAAAPGSGAGGSGLGALLGLFSLQRSLTRQLALAAAVEGELAACAACGAGLGAHVAVVTSLRNRRRNRPGHGSALGLGDSARLSP